MKFELCDYSTDDQMADMQAVKSQLQIIMHIIAETPLGDILDAIGRMHTFAPFVDPTGYRTVIEDGNTKRWEGVFRAALTFQKAVAAFLPPADGPEDTEAHA